VNGVYTVIASSHPFTRPPSSTRSYQYSVTLPITLTRYGGQGMSVETETSIHRHRIQINGDVDAQGCLVGRGHPGAYGRAPGAFQRKLYRPTLVPPPRSWIFHQRLHFFYRATYDCL